jgi:hypothetical protein
MVAVVGVMDGGTVAVGVDIVGVDVDMEHGNMTKIIYFLVLIFCVFFWYFAIKAVLLLV